MKYYLILTICCLGFTLGCNKTGTPVEFSQACNIENEKKYLEVSGFLDDKGSVYCSNRSGRMECSFKLKENPTGEKTIGAEIEVGTAANTVEELKKNFKREDIKIRDNNGNIISLTDKVKLTGQMSITPDGKVCFMTVTKIEK
jgi:hypothetical protein